MSQLSALRHALNTQVYNPIKSIKQNSSISSVALPDSSAVEIPMVTNPTNNAAQEPAAHEPTAQANEIQTDSGSGHQPTPAPQAEISAVTGELSRLNKQDDINRLFSEGVLLEAQGPTTKPLPMAQGISIFSPETPTLALPPLEPRHRTFLHGRHGVGHARITQRGYSSIPASAQGRRILRSLGFTTAQVGEGGGLLIPQRNFTGMVTSYVYRPDRQRLDAEGRQVEFERLSANAGVLDIDIPATLQKQTLSGRSRAGLTIWTTNPICADSATALAVNVVNINGLSLSWNDLLSARVRGNFGLDELNEDSLFVFNSDWSESEAVYTTLNNLMKFFALRGQVVRMAFLPPGPQGEKRTLSSFIARRGTLEELLAQAIFSPGSTA